MKCHKPPKMMPMTPMMPMMHSVGKNSAARRNNHAAAINMHTWRKLSGRYDPRRPGTVGTHLPALPAPPPFLPIYYKYI